MKALVARIGLYRVAALLIAGALVLEILRIEVFGGAGTAGIACTLGEVALLVVAAAVFVRARRAAAGR